MSKLKVYGASAMLTPQLSEALGIPARLRQTRAVIACTSLRVARDVMGVGLSYLAETGNDAEITAAMSEPGTVFYETEARTYLSEAQALAQPRP